MNSCKNDCRDDSNSTDNNSLAPNSLYADLYQIENKDVMRAMALSYVYQLCTVNCTVGKLAGEVIELKRQIAVLELDEDVLKQMARAKKQHAKRNSLIGRAVYNAQRN